MYVYVDIYKSQKKKKKKKKKKRILLTLNNKINLMIHQRIFFLHFHDQKFLL